MGYKPPRPPKPSKPPRPPKNPKGGRWLNVAYRLCYNISNLAYRRTHDERNRLQRYLH